MKLRNFQDVCWHCRQHTYEYGWECKPPPNHYQLNFQLYGWYSLVKGIWTQSLGQGKNLNVPTNCRFSTIKWLECNSSIACYIKLNLRPAPTQPCWPIRSMICFSTAVSARALGAGQSKETVQIHQTPFPRESWLWARYCIIEEWLCGLFTRAYAHNIAVTPAGGSGDLQYAGMQLFILRGALAYHFNKRGV